MADTVSTTVVSDTQKRLVVHLTSLSDGTGESSVLKIDKADYIGLNGVEPQYFVLEKVVYDVSSMRVRIDWDYSSPLEMVVLQGHNQIDFRKTGGLLRKGEGNTGGVLLTTANHTSGDGYDITLYLRKKG